jgi:hypothetical protein
MSEAVARFVPNRASLNLSTTEPESMKITAP